MLPFVAEWYIIYTGPRKEKKIAEKLLEKNITHFLPLIKSNRKWHDRNKIIHVPAFPSYIFVYLDGLSTYREVLEIDGVYNYVKFGKITAIVKQEVIDQIRVVINSNNVIISSAYFEPGEKLIIQEGPLKGIHCETVKSHGENKILVRVQFLNRSILVDVPGVYLSKLVC